MRAKLTQQRVVVILAACVAVVVGGYSSSAVSLSQCTADTASWLSKDAPAGATAGGHHAEPACLFLPFVASVEYEKHHRLAPQEYLDEWGQRYYFTCFGAVFPLGEKSRSMEHVAD